ncbi:mercuric transporter MerT family protein [Pseudomonas sp. LFM046]|uniref:mercuric transporter MerT family protein n=1 Tax=Pseudomonas sp. LFM046 TaxID=1608357 RepID=UPI0005CFD1D4|nr:mercuric transporter MerT family protein [Pseudomonas sp. LFM046]
MAVITVTRALLAGLLAGVGASACCYIPAVLIALGRGSSAWVLALSKVSPYRPALAGLTLLCLGLALTRLYLVPPCVVNGSAVQRRALVRQRQWFWWTTTLLLVLLAAPWFAPLLR